LILGDVTRRYRVERSFRLSGKSWPGGRKRAAGAAGFTVKIKGHGVFYRNSPATPAFYIAAGINTRSNLFRPASSWRFK
jgi:hypothetical protein